MSTTNNQPQVETYIKAATTGNGPGQNVTVYVTALDSETDQGWYVYGYRLKGRNAGRRMTATPNLYFVSK